MRGISCKSLGTTEYELGPYTEYFSHALDSLHNAEHIEAVDEDLTIYRAKDVKGTGRAYDISLETE